MMDGKVFTHWQKNINAENSFAAGLRNICYSLKKKNYKWKEGEGTSQRTYVSDPQTWTAVQGLAVGVGGGGRHRGKIGTTVIQ